MWQPLDPQRFDEVILDGVRPIAIGALMDALDDAGDYWPAGWPVARKRAHIRRRLWTSRNTAGWPRFMWEGWTDWLWLDPNKERASRLTPPEARPFIDRIASPHWQTLDEIRTHLEADAWFSPPATEREQVETLEAILGTEFHLPEPSLDDSENELAVVACIWDDLDAPEPQPVYKVGEMITEEDRAREMDHLNAVRKDIQDVADARRRASTHLRRRSEGSPPVG